MARLGAQLAAVTTGEARQLRAVARGGALNLIGAGISAVLQLVTAVAITRMLAKSGAGQFFTATSLFLLLEALVVSGATTGVIYFIARSRARRRYGDVRKTLLFSLGPVVAASVLVAVTTPLWAPSLAGLLSGGKATVGTSGLVLLFAALPLAAVSDLSLAGTAGYRTMRPTVFVERIGRPTLQLVLVLLVLPKRDPALLALAWVLPYLASSLVAALWLRRLVERDPRENQPVPEGSASADTAAPADPADQVVVTMGTFWRYTVPRGVASVAQTALQRLDIVLVGTISGAVNAALYTAATRFLVVGQMISQSIATSVQPRLAGWFATGDTAAVSRTYKAATGWVVLVAWPFYLVCAWCAPYWLRVFGSGYSSASQVVVILVASMLVATGCGMVSMVLVMGGRTVDNLVNTVVALTLNVGLNLWLIPLYGITGAAVSWAVAIAANNLLPLAQVWRHRRIHPFGSASRLAMGLSAVLLGVLPGAVVLVLGRTLTATVVGCALGAALYAALVLRFRDVFDLHAFGLSRRR